MELKKFYIIFLSSVVVGPWFVACNKYYQNDGFEHSLSSSRRRIESAVVKSPTSHRHSPWAPLTSSSLPIIIISAVRSAALRVYLSSKYTQEKKSCLVCCCCLSGELVLSNDNYTWVKLMAKHMCLLTDAHNPWQWQQLNRWWW